MELRLPSNIISQVDVARVLRELNKLNDFFVDANARQAGASMRLPRLTRLLDQLAHDNNYNLLDGQNRNKLAGELDIVLGNAPLIHISFASEPSPKALERILVWFRQNIHPQTLLQVGLQPTIAAGCVLRTPNKVLDLSMRSYLKQQQPFLIQLIDGAARGR